MPKSKVRKKPDVVVTTSANRTPVKVSSPSPRWYPILMVTLLVLGLAYLVVYYLTNSGTQPHVPGMGDIGAWNFAVGFGIMLLGLVLAVKWR